MFSKWLFYTNINKQNVGKCSQDYLMLEILMTIFLLKYFKMFTFFVLILFPPIISYDLKHIELNSFLSTKNLWKNLTSVISIDCSH